MDNKISQFVFEKAGIDKYKKFLDLASLKQKLISGNVANVSTPGYRARDIDFQGEFARATQKTSSHAVAVTHERHIPLGQHESRPPKVDHTDVTVGELNSVDIDEEVSKLAQNELMFTVAAKLVQRKFDGIRKAITSK